MKAEEYEPEERNALDELKKRMKGIIDNELYEDDNLFYRFLKGYEFNIDKAEMLLKQHLEWRKQYDVKNASKYKHPEVLEKYVPLNKIGHDKEGGIIRYAPSGNIDWIGVNSSCKRDDLTKLVISIAEEDMKDLRIQSKKLGKTVDKVIYLHSLEHFSFKQATDKKVVFNFIFLLNLYQSNYPETLKGIYIIKASRYFSLLFSVLQKFLPSSILKKIHVYSDDSWREDFLQMIDADVLPAFLGGNRTDPDGNPLCLTFINHGESVPEKYYIHRSKRSLANLPDVRRITVPRAKFHDVFVEVKEPNSFLEWEFETKNGDIGFGLFYQDDEENKTELISIQRINTDEFSETGIYKCDNVGRYIIIFDNTHTLLRKKDIFYKIKVMTSQEEATHLVQ